MLGVGSVPFEPPRSELDAYGPERDAWAVLASVVGLGPIGFAALLMRYGSAMDVLTDAARPGAAKRLVETPGADISRFDRPIRDDVATAIVDVTQRSTRILARLRELDVRVV